MSQIIEQTAPKNERLFVTRAAHATIDFVFIVLMLLLLLLSIYIKMDSDSVYTAADPKQWIGYKPTADDTLSFEELQKLNSDVIGWLTIYGTNIDYPLVHSDSDNNYYLSHNPEKKPESSGSLYLDFRNKPDFYDFNINIHGHHMEKHKMFGDLDQFAEEKFFQSHEFGNIFYNGQNHGLQIIAVILADGYDGKLYQPGLTNDEAKLTFINHIYEEAKYIRGVDMSKRKELVAGVTSPLTPNDKILVFSTCNLTKTNGRYVVIAKVLDHTVDNPYKGTEIKKTERIDTFTLFNQYGSLPLWIWIAIVILLTILVYVLYRLSRRRDRRIANRNAETSEGEDAYDQ